MLIQSRPDRLSITQLTPVSPVYTEDVSVDLKSASLLNIERCSHSGPALSEMGLISELNSEQHNLHH